MITWTPMTKDELLLVAEVAENWPRGRGHDWWKLETPKSLHGYSKLVAADIEDAKQYG